MDCTILLSSLKFLSPPCSVSFGMFYQDKIMQNYRVGKSHMAEEKTSNADVSQTRRKELPVSVAHNVLAGD